jgi:hypothetical protein
VALQNKRVIYDLLFRACAETLLEVAANPDHLGAEIGFLSVLHTWGQNLLHHRRERAGSVDFRRGIRTAAFYRAAASLIPET